MRPRRSAPRRRSSSPGSALACVAAAVGLVAVMGVALHDRGRTATARSVPVLAAPPPLRPAEPEPVARVPRAEGPLDRLTRAVRAAEAKTPSLRRRVRGEDFESARVELLSEVSAARDELGAWLDRHPSDDRANRLWDRVLRLYVALRKL